MAVVLTPHPLEVFLLCVVFAGTAILLRTAWRAWRSGDPVVSSVHAALNRANPATRPVLGGIAVLVAGPALVLNFSVFALFLPVVGIPVLIVALALIAVAGLRLLGRGLTGAWDLLAWGRSGQRVSAWLAGDLAVAAAVIGGLAAYSLVALVKPAWAEPSAHCPQVSSPRSDVAAQQRWNPVEVPDLRTRQDVAAAFGLPTPPALEGTHPASASVRQDLISGGVAIEFREASYRDLSELRRSARRALGGPEITAEPTPVFDNSVSFKGDRFSGQITMTDCRGRHRPNGVTVGVFVGPDRVGDCRPVERQAACAEIYEAAAEAFHVGFQRTPQRIVGDPAGLAVVFDQPGLADSGPEWAAGTMLGDLIGLGWDGQVVDVERDGPTVKAVRVRAHRTTPAGSFELTAQLVRHGEDAALVTGRVEGRVTSVPG
ncbi:MAG: hypothetical protein ACT4PX_12190 [Actinomycetota bacterium]